MTFQIPNHPDQAAQLANLLADQFESHFRSTLEQRLSAFFGHGCAETFTDVAVEYMTPALQQLAELPASPSVSPSGANPSRVMSPTRGVGFARKSLGTASIDVEVSIDDSRNA